MVSTNAYKNSSNVVRDALTRLMESSDVAGLTEIGANATNLSAVTSIDKQLPNITGNLMVTFKLSNTKIDKRINKLEYQFRKLIKIKNNNYSPPNVTYTYVLEGSTFEFHSFVSNLNSIEEIDNLRYNIVDEIEDEEVGKEKV
jgi:hypothetical protein